MIMDVGHITKMFMAIWLHGKGCWSYTHMYRDVCDNKRVTLIISTWTITFILSLFPLLTHHLGTADSSPAYEEFLALLGETVRLKGWKKYRAGLDVESASYLNMFVLC